jgi:hypothetical protein
LLHRALKLLRRRLDAEFNEAENDLRLVGMPRALRLSTKLSF